MRDFVCFLAIFHCFDWPNIEQIIKEAIWSHCHLVSSIYLFSFSSCSSSCKSTLEMGGISVMTNVPEKMLSPSSAVGLMLMPLRRSVVVASTSDGQIKRCKNCVMILIMTTLVKAA